MITIFFFCLVSFFLGYWAAKSSNMTNDIKIVVDKARELLPDNSIKAGILKRPNVKELFDRTIPTKIKEGREEMKKVLDNIPELQEHKELLKKLEEMQP